MGSFDFKRLGSLDGTVLGLLGGKILVSFDSKRLGSLDGTILGLLGGKLLVSFYCNRLGSSDGMGLLDGKTLCQKQDTGLVSWQDHNAWIANFLPMSVKKCSKGFRVVHAIKAEKRLGMKQCWSACTEPKEILELAGRVAHY